MTVTVNVNVNVNVNLNVTVEIDDGYQAKLTEGMNNKKAPVVVRFVLFSLSVSLSMNVFIYSCPMYP